MCEFKVFDRERLIAQEIVYANVSGNTLALKDVLGFATNVEDVVVSEIDVARETIRLKKSPLIGDVLQFIDAVSRCEESGKYDKNLEDIWQKVKSGGDETIRELWRKTEKMK